MRFDHGMSDRPLPRRALLPGASLALLASAGMIASGCDSTATLFPQKVLFSRAMIVSAYPAQERADGTWARQCGAGAVDGIITNVALISTQRKDGDNDLQIRPGDVIDTRTVEGGLPDDINLTNEGHMALAVDCIDPQPHPNPSGDGCQGAQPSFALDQTTYQAHTERDTGHNVLLLLDQSGSISGLVDADHGNIENRTGDFVVPSNFGELASDGSNVRLSAARRFIRTLNDEDRFGALAFSEKLGIQVPCSEAQGDLQADLDACFGKRNTDIWLSTSGLDSLIGRAEGRSNLWDAVAYSYDYLRALDDTKRSNHIIVVTDGPDTCANSLSMGTCQFACSNTSHQDVLAKIEADLADPNAPRIHVHFIQFESLGYPGRDPRQVEVSCVSGGQYQYLNTNQFPSAQPTQFQEALETAIVNVRYMLMGHWELASAVPAYVNNAGTPPGSLYALNGLLTVKTSSQMVLQDKPFPFNVGQGAGAENASVWDRRPSLRKPCTSETECGAAAGTASACSVVCSPETMTCAGFPRDQAFTAPNFYACAASGGGEGFCCEGACETTGTCAVCTE